MSETIWVTDEECCGKCGALLDYFDTDLCFFCDEEEFREEWAREEEWWTEEDEEEPTIGTPEEAYAVALSLSDEDMSN